jgi:mono/diheme cytochrome c family protein
MNCARRNLLLSVVLALLAGATPSASLAEPAVPTPEQIEFFEKNVRPVLANRCWKCHGSEKQESGLRLDAGDAVLKGGESGAVIVPGEPDKSALIVAIRYQGETQMPPSAKLPENELAALVAWVQMGAPWPKDASASSGTENRPKSSPSPQETQTTHWAFQPIVRLAPPAVTRADWCATPVDNFILRELEASGLTPSAPTNRRTLLRRASFDLIGLPPTPEEVEAFERDASPDAWQKVVDRLLASPHYGERWARHWLDVARYADTKGYVFAQERRYPFSYTYRDYVVRAMNEDLPYDQFLREQLAADCLPLGDDKRPLAALGFLTVGRRFMLNVHDIIDDRIDVVSRGLLGLTVGCARCHDHKFDPIPSADYYSLYGVFASSTEPEEEPLICRPEETAGYDQFLQKKAALQKEVDDYRAAKQRELEQRLRSQAGEYLAQLIRQRPGEPPHEEPMISLGPGELRPRMVERWREFIERPEASKDPVLAPWRELAAIPPAEFAQRAGAVFDRWTSASEAAPPVNALIKQAIVERRPTSMLDVARLYGELLASVDKQWTEACKATLPPERLSDSAAEELRQVLYGPESPTKLSDERAQRLFDREARDHLTALKRKVDEWEATSPSAPPRAMALVDVPTPVEPQIFLRGNPGRPGERVPRRFLAVLSHGERRPFEHGSGRLDLAQAIASRDNPLTARVLVNRIWMHHFGSPLVRTPSDFGVRSEPPSHPALLDWLAATFMDEGWSLKRLHRLILLSSAYQQASDERPECAAVDPENRLLWRMNRRRLDFESMRDGYLAVSKALDDALGGRPIDIWAPPFSSRRSVYAYIDRQDLPGVFRVFDFANPDVSNDQRPRTTVPQQALFAMNSAFAIEQVRRLVARPEVAGETDPGRRVAALYRLVLQRSPTADEAELALRFVNAANSGSSSKLSPWELLGQVLLSTNEFMFVD